MVKTTHGENIKVEIRCCPLPKTQNILYLFGNQNEPKSFLFNSVYSPKTSQQFIYNDSARPIINSVLEGYNGTIFTYQNQ